MRMLMKSTILTCMLFLVFSAPALSQGPSGNLQTKVDVVIAAAYHSASVAFPCKLKAKGKAKMLTWQGVEKCVNKAFDQVQWNELSLQLQAIRKEGRYSALELSVAIDTALTTQALPFSRVFSVKEKDALLPLSNSLLKFLPTESLVDLPVYDKSGKSIGTFAGVYAYEKLGQISGNKYRQSLFQYKDANGRLQAPPDRLLLDSFGVPWKDAISRPGFCLPTDRFILKN